MVVILTIEKKRSKMRSSFYRANYIVAGSIDLYSLRVRATGVSRAATIFFFHFDAK